MRKPNDLARLWLEMENELFPALNFDTVERALYYFLFARTHLLGRRSVRLSIPQIARATQLSWYIVRHRTLQLRAKGCLRVRRRNPSGSIWELKLPRQVLGRKRRGAVLRQNTFDPFDCSFDPRARRAFLRRERGYCFYCQRKITRTTTVLDHVVPRSRGGGTSYRNLVACCPECNSSKRVSNASSFLRTLFRSGRLSAAEFNQRLSALGRLLRGDLRISIAA